MAIGRNGVPVFSQLMREKTQAYEAEVLEAQIVNRDRGAVSKTEAVCYDRAAKICEEIMSLNVSQRSVYNEWDKRRNKCIEKRNQIVESIKVIPVMRDSEEVGTGSSPTRTTAPVGSASRPTKKAEDMKSNDSCIMTNGQEFTTQYATEDVPLDTIKGWIVTKRPHTFDKVTGMAKVKELLMEEAAEGQYERLDEVLRIEPDKALLAYGPPGTGKTHIIKGWAGELMGEEYGYNFMKIKGGEIRKKYLGVTEKVIYTIFNVAMEHAPCLVFIDEIEEMCVDRGSVNEGGSHASRTTVAFLESITEIVESDKAVIFVAATNFPDKIDSAMMDRFKPLRFPLPDEEARIAQFRYLFGDLQLEDGFTYDDIAEATDNYSYRDIKKLRRAIARKLKKDILKDKKVLNDEGNVDTDVTDILSCESIVSGEVRLTRELFTAMQKEVPPLNKTAIRESLRKFEEGLLGN